MKKLFITLLLLSTILLTNAVAQQISATAYNKTIIHEDFSAEGDFFPTVTTTDNYFIIDKGDYLLSRNNEDSEYAIIASNSSVNDFILKTSVRIGPNNNKTASVGIILKSQQENKGAIIFEINKKGEYRIKQLLGDTYTTLSGSSKQEGWVRGKTINGVDEHNVVEIRTEKNIYDVYVNSDYLTTFFIPDYTSGSCGIMISPGTKARIAYYYINTQGGNEQSVATYTNVHTTVEELNQDNETLEKNNATLNNLNTEARENQDEEISNLTHKNADLAAVTIGQEKEIASLQRRIADLKNKNTELTNDLNKVNKSSNSRMTQLTTAINVLQAAKKTLTTDLTKEKNAHTKTKNGLSKSVTNKIDEINELTIALSNAKKQLKSANITNAHLKESVLNSENLSAELKQANNELNTLRKIQEQNDEVTDDLNSKVEALNNQLSTANTELKKLSTTNTELKALFIQKDFEINGVKPSDLTKHTKIYPTTKELKGDNTIYTVQFGVYMQVQPYAALKGLDEVWYETTEHSTYVYLSGQFKAPQEATEHKNSLITLGYPNAFVVTLTK